MRVRLSKDIGAPRKIGWKEHCSDPGFVFGVLLFAFFGTGFFLVSVIEGEIVTGIQVMLAFFVAIICFAVFTKRAADNGTLLNSYEACISDSVGGKEEYDLFATILGKECRDERERS